MQTNVLNMRGEVVRTIELDDRVFGITPNQAVVHQAVVTQQANARQGTHDTKTRGEVAGGGRKPWREKGTGRARQGSTRAPHWRGGGVVFGPHPRSYEKALPRKMRRLAMRSVLSSHAAEQRLIVLEGFELEQGKTRELVEALATLGLGDGALVVLGERSDRMLRAARNLQQVHVVTPNGLNLLDLLRLPRLVLTEAAIDELTRTLTSDLRAAAEPTRAQAESPAAAPAGTTASAARGRRIAAAPAESSAAPAEAPAAPAAETTTEAETSAPEAETPEATKPAPRRRAARKEEAEA